MKNIKKSLFLFLSILPFLLAAENYSLLCQEGGQAYKAKKFELALEKYSRAHKVAGTPAQKFRIIPVQITLYQQLKKTAELEKFLEKERQNNAYDNRQLRYLLNWNARIHIWPRRNMDHAMKLLNMARLLPVPPADNSTMLAAVSTSSRVSSEEPVTLTSTPVAPLMEVSSRGLETAAVAACSAFSRQIGRAHV